MNFKLFNHRLGNVLKQRNFLLVLAMALLCLSFLLSFALIFKEEKVIMVPTELRQEVWLQGKQVSAAYLEEMGILYADLLLEQTPAGSAFRRDIILRNSTASGYGALKVKLLEEEKRLKKENFSTSFQPKSIKVERSKMAVEITGDLLRYVVDKRISQSRDTYRIEFEYHRGRLLIKTFQLIKSDRNEK